LITDKVLSVTAIGQWFFPGTPVSSTNKVGGHINPRTVVSVSKHYKNKRIGLEQSGPHHHLIEN